MSGLDIKHHVPTIQTLSQITECPVGLRSCLSYLIVVNIYARGERHNSVGQNESSLYCITYLLSKLNFLE